MNVARKLLVERTGCVTHGSNQLSQQKPETEMGLSRKDLWRTPAYNCGIPLISTEDQHGFENVVSPEILPAWTESETGQNEGSLSDF